MDEELNAQDDQEDTLQVLFASEKDLRGLTWQVVTLCVFGGDNAWVDQAADTKVTLAWK